jgi:autotransporter-associated beta strand protein
VGLGRGWGRWLAALVTTLVTVSAADAQTYTWTAVSGSTAVNWAAASGTTSGWSGGVPGTATPGSTAVISSLLASTTVTQSVAAGGGPNYVQLGNLTYGGGAVGNFSFTITNTNGLTLNNLGSGAAVVNSNTTAGTTNALIFGGTGNRLTLQDTVTFSNTGASTNATGAIQIQNIISGNGSLVFSNAGSAAVSQTSAIHLTGANTFFGDVLIQKGTTSFSTATALGNANNLVTLGSAGGGAATLISTGAVSVAQNVVVAAGAGGTLTLGTISTGTAGFTGSVLLNGDLTITGAATTGTGVTFSGNMSGAGGLTKVGAGAATLSGTNTYAGPTVVNAGYLQFASAAAVAGTGRSVTVNAGASVATTYAIDQAFLNRLVTTSAGVVALGLDSGNNLDFTGLAGVSLGAIGVQTYSGTITTAGGAYRLGGGNSTSSLTVSGLLTGANTLTVAANGTSAGTVTLTGANTFTGKTTVAAGTLVVTSLNSVAGGTASSSLGAPTTVANGTISLGSTTTAATLTYAGAGETTDRAIDLAGTTGGATINANGTGPLTFTGGASASVAGAKTLTLTGTNTDANTVSGAITNGAGTVAVTKAGAGQWVLSGTNTYTGATAMSAGTLTMSGSFTTASVTASAGTLNLGGTVSAATTLSTSGAAFNFTGSAPALTTLTVSAGQFNMGGTVGPMTTGTTVSGGTLTVAAGVVLPGTVNVSGTTGIARYTDVGGIGGTGRTVTATGTAAPLYAINQAFLDRLAVASAGVAALGADSGNNLDFTAFTGALSLGALTPAATYSGTITPAAGTYRLGGGGGTLTLTQPLTGANNLNVVGVIAGSTVALPGTSTYTGTTTIAGGVASVDLIGNTTSTASGFGNAAGASSSVINLGATTVAGTLRYTGPGETTNRVINLAGTSGGGVIDASGTGPLVVASAITFATTAKTLTLTGTNAGANAISSPITDTASGAVSLAKTGTGTWVLPAANTFTGATTISGGVLHLPNGGTLGAATTRNVTVASGGALSLEIMDQNLLTTRVVASSAGVVALGANSAAALDFSTTGAALTAASFGASGNYTFTGTLTPNNATYRLGGGGGNLTFDTTLSGANALTVNVNGGAAASIVTLTQSNNYTGATTVTAGTLRIMNGNAIPDGGSTGDLSIAAAGTLQFASNFDEAVNGLSGAGTIDTAAGLVTTPVTLTLGTAANATFSGTIKNTGAALNLIKNGTGTQVLSGVNTYTGTTTVNAGVLQFNTAGSLGATAAALTIISGGTAAAGYAIDQTFLARVSPASAGVVALAADSSGNLDLGTPGLTGASLGSTGSFTYSGTLTPAGSTYRLGGGGGTLTVSGPLTGAGNSLVVDTNGTGYQNVVVLSNAANTYGGTTTVAGGTLLVTNPGALYNAVAANWVPTNIVVGPNAVLGFSLGGSGFTAAQLDTLRAMGTAAGGFKDGSFLGVDTGNGDATYGSVVGNTNGGANAVGFAKLGANTLTLTGPNTFTGSVRVDGGTLAVATVGTVGGGPSNLGSPATAAAGQIALGFQGNTGTLRYTGAGATTDRTIALTGQTGGGAIDASGTGPIVFTSPVTVAAGGARTFTLLGTNTGDNTLTGGIGDNGGVTGVTKLGTGTWVMAGTNSYSGPTVIDGGTFKMVGVHNLNTTTAPDAKYTVGSVAGVSGALVVGTGAQLRTNFGLFVGENGTGTATVTDGSVETNYDSTGAGQFIGIGRNAGSTGTWTQSGGTATVYNDWFVVGVSGAGTATHTGGTINALVVCLSQNSGSSGSFTLNGGTVSTSNVYVGYNPGGNATLTITNGSITTGFFGTGVNGGGGTVNMSGGTVTVTSFASIARAAGSTGTLILSGGTINDANDFNVGDFGAATATQTGGQLNSGNLILGWNEPSSGVMTQNGAAAAIAATGAFWVGYRGRGEFTQIDGSITVNSFTSLARAQGSYGKMTKSGGSITVTGDFNVADYGVADMTMSGGTISTAGGTGFVIGFNAGSRGTLTMTGGTITATAAGSDVRIGNAGVGVLNLSGGSISSSDWSYVGVNSPGRGTFNLSGTGVFSPGDNFAIGYNAGTVGLMTMTGGTVTIVGNDPAFTGNLLIAHNGTGTLNISAGLIDLVASNTSANSLNSASFSLTNSGGLTQAQDGNIYVGEQLGTGVLTQSGGTIKVSANVFVGGFSGTAGATGTLTISGGVMQVGVRSPTGGDLVLGSPATSPVSTATVNLQGGLLDVSNGSGMIGSGGGGNLAFNFTGGTLKVKVWNPSLAGGDLGPLVQNGPTSLLDVTGNDTLINGGYTLTAGAVAVGTGRTLKTGTATLGAGASISGAGTLDANLVYNATGNSTFAGNIIGAANALTVNGPGTLTLTGASTYGGATSVTGGTLKGSGSITSSVTVSTGGTLAAGTGTGAAARTFATGAVTFNPGSAFRTQLFSTAAGDMGNLVSGGTVTFVDSTPRIKLDLTGLSEPALAAGGTQTYTILSGTSVSMPGGPLTSANIDLVNNTGGFLASEWSLVTNPANVQLVYTPAPVPEPATALAVAAAGLGLAGWARRRR